MEPQSSASPLTNKRLLLGSGHMFRIQAFWDLTFPFRQGSGIWLFWALCLCIGITLVACAGPGKPADTGAAPTAAAQKLYVAKCAKCHKFYDPAKYSDEEWSRWMVKMSRKAKLTPDQESMLSRYIEQTYRTPAKPNTNPEKAP
jgi:hypothetical protein